MIVCMSVNVSITMDVSVAFEEVGMERHVWEPSASPSPSLVFFTVRHGLAVQRSEDDAVVPTGRMLIEGDPKLSEAAGC